MGYFANLYLVEATSISDTKVEITTTIYKGNCGDTAYFSWIRGGSRENLHSYAHGTIYSDIELNELPGYPVAEKQDLGEKTGHIPPSILIEAQFTPKIDHQTVCHMIMPRRYLPRRDLEPLTQPSYPYVNLLDEHVILTWPIQDRLDIKFCATPLDKNESFSGLPITKILHPEESTRTSFGTQFNLGIVKFDFRRGP